MPLRLDTRELAHLSHFPGFFPCIGKKITGNPLLNMVDWETVVAKCFLVLY